MLNTYATTGLANKDNYSYFTSKLNLLFTDYFFALINKIILSIKPYSNPHIPFMDEATIHIEVTNKLAVNYHEYFYSLYIKFKNTYVCMLFTLRKSKITIVSLPKGNDFQKNSIIHGYDK